MVSGVLAHPGGPVGVEIVPDQDDGGLELDVGAHDQVAVVTPGEAVAPGALVLAVLARPVDQPGSLARPMRPMFSADSNLFRRES